MDSIKYLPICITVALIVLSSCARPDTTNHLDQLELSEITIAEVHAAFRQGSLSSEELIQYYLDRIEKWNDKINAITYLNPDALSEAKSLDSLFRTTGKLLPLHGIPMLVKDNYHTKGLPTTAGSKALAGFIPENDAFQIQKLKAAGAIILAKTNMAEWAFSPMHTNSSTFGTTKNPYSLKHVPAGSSGGTAAGIASNLGLVGLGTDTGNSIRGPSSHTALVGIRSSLGLTSRSGIIPLYLRNDVGGPMCRTVTDAAKVLEVIAGVDATDPITQKGGDYIKSYTDYLDTDALTGARIGVLRGLADEPPNQEIDSLFQAALGAMSDQGAQIVDSIYIQGFDSLRRNQWCSEFRKDIEAHLKEFVDDPDLRSLEDLVDKTTATPFARERMNYFLTHSGRAAGLPPCGDAFTDPHRIAFRQAIEEAMDREQVDVLVYPSWEHPPANLLNFEEEYLGDNSQIIAPHTGQPAITVPMGFTSGSLPAGLQILGRLFDEARIIAIAYSYEQHTHHRRPPADFGL